MIDMPPLQFAEVNDIRMGYYEAGPTTDAPAAQAVLVTADTVRDFLKANGVSAAGSSPDARASVIRVICVRK